MNIQKSQRKRISTNDNTTNEQMSEATHTSYNILVSNEIVNIIDDGIDGITEVQLRLSLDATTSEQNSITNPEERRWLTTASFLFHQILRTFLDILDPSYVHAVTIHDDEIDSSNNSTEGEEQAQTETIYGDPELDSLINTIDLEYNKLACSKKQESEGRQQEYVCLENIFE